MSDKAGWIANFLDEINLPITDEAAAELRRLARVEANQAELLNALQKIAAIEDNDFGVDFEEIDEAREIARAAIAKATGEQS